MVGDKYLDFNDPANVIVQSLPQPSVATNLQDRVYDGTMPELSQFIEYDQNGDLLFFAVDGNIYDRDGYLMVKTGVGGFTPYPNYPEYTANIQIIKIPNECNKYFILLGHTNLAHNLFSMCLLDLDLPNAYWTQDPLRKGALIDFGPYMDLIYDEDLAGAAAYYPINFYDFLTQDDFVSVSIYGELVVVDAPLYGGVVPAVNSRYADITIIDTGLNNNKKLLISKGNVGYVLSIEADGIFYGQNPQCISFTNDNMLLNNQKSVSNFEGNYYVFAANEMDNHYHLAKYSASFVLQQCFPTGFQEELMPVLPQSISASEASANGRYFYFYGNSAPYFNYLDLTDEYLYSHELTGINALSNAGQYEGCKMVRNFYQGVESIYLFSLSGISVLKGVNNPSTIQLIADPFPGLTVPTYDIANWSGADPLASYSTFSNPVITQEKTFGLQQMEELQQPACCYATHIQESWSTRTFGSGTATWQNGGNPFNDDASVVYVEGDLIFNAGANITISGMEFRFGPNANVIINPGALIKLQNGTKWTSYECEGLMWPGVNMIGQSTLDQPSTETTYASNQPILVLDHSIIENALVGVEVGTTTANSGGVLKGYTATFHNCRAGVRYQPYSHIQYGVWYTSRWIVDAHLKDPALYPNVMVSMRQMSGNISFSGCSFIHDTPFSVYPMWQRGYGIYADNSRFSVSGGSGSYTGPTDLIHTTFYKWQYGIKAINGGATSFSSLNMYFQENNIGLTATNVNSESIVNNVFHIPDIAYISTQKPRGVILTGCTGYTFRENDFYATTYNGAAQNVGAMIVNSGDFENESYRNDFVKLWKGQEVQGDNRGQDALIGLQLRCNTYSNTKYDQYLASTSEWRHNQGDVLAMTKMANNKFSLYHPNCVDGNYDMYVHPNHAPLFVFDYIRPNNEWYDPNSSDNNSNCTSSHMEDFCPFSLSNVTNPVYSSICPTYSSITSPGSGMIILEDAVSSLDDTRNVYQLVVDANEKSNIETEIQRAYPMESQLMRDYLLQRTPLSDQIIKDAIDEYGLLDSWHLTQVLLSNSPLTKDVLLHLESTGVLSPFFMSFLYEASETNAPGYRKLLEYEISARESDRHNALAALKEYFNQHADQVDIETELYPIMIADGSSEAKIWLLDYYISQGDETSARGILWEMANWTKMTDYIALKEMQLDLLNDWFLASTAQLDDIQAWASDVESPAFGAALSILHSLGISELLPEPEVPDEERSMKSTEVKRMTFEKPLLSAYPNPANAITYLSYPIEADGIGRLEIHDELGQLVLSSNLISKGIFELNTANMQSGIYMLRIMVEGKSVAEGKLIVIE